VRNEHDAAGRGAELLCGWGWAARRAAVERSGTGGAGTAARLAVGHVVAGACEDNEPHVVLARGLPAGGYL